METQLRASSQAYQTTIVLAERSSLSLKLGGDLVKLFGGNVCVAQAYSSFAKNRAFDYAKKNNCRVGDGHVGYVEKFDSIRRKDTLLMYVEAAMLTQEILLDPTLDKYNALVIDDFQERALEMDILVSFLRRIVLKRQDLRVFVLCSTESSADFALTRFKRPGYPDWCATIVDCRVQRHRHSNIMYTPKPVRNIVSEAVNIVKRIHRTTELLGGNILVFFPTEENVNEFVAQVSHLENLHTTEWTGSKALYVSGGSRNCIVASNVLESYSSVKVRFQNVRFVIDSMLTKRTLFDVGSGVESYRVVPITKEEACVRSEFASDTVVRLCTEELFQTQVERALPPLFQRSDLTACVLQMKWLRVDDIVHFDYLSPPPAEAVVRALDTLRAIDAIDNKGDITSPTGTNLALFLPLSPIFAKALLLSLDVGCSEEMLTIISMLQTLTVGVSGDLFTASKNKSSRMKRDDCICTFGTREGDLIMLLNIYNYYKNDVPNKQQKAWCTANSLNVRVLEASSRLRGKLRKRLQTFAEKEKQELQSCFQDVESIQICICRAFFLTAARLNSDGKTYSTVSTNEVIRIHPSSLFAHFAGAPPPWIASPKLQSNVKYITRIRPEWLVKFCSNVYFSQDETNPTTKQRRLDFMQSTRF
mmetsp:Transcript_2257/g.4310  ORF Transcript_2257/g.4310 Transcript_2257/m.4310 type:complete len:645 (+) Transcript_2257:62-1996(+)